MQGAHGQFLTGTLSTVHVFWMIIKPTQRIMLAYKIITSLSLSPAGTTLWLFSLG